MTMNIMCDPRVVRGSVAARQRELARQARLQAEATRAEERLHLEQIRNKLSVLVTKEAFGGRAGGGRGRRSRPAEVAKLAGKIGRPAEVTAAGTTALPPLVVQMDRQRPKPKSGSQPSGDGDGFKNVRFVPLKSLLPQEVAMAKEEEVVSTVVPILPPLQQQSMPTTTIQPSNHLGHFQVPHPVRPRVPLKRPRGSLYLPHSPPPSSYGPIHLTESSIQTEEPFDVHFDDLISEMAITAIADALRSLAEEQRRKVIAERNKKLAEEVREHEQRNAVLVEVVEQTKKEQLEIMRERELALQKWNALESRQLASELMDELAEKSMGELAAHRMISPDRMGATSIAVDTRHLERIQMSAQLQAAEIERDFFPYVYAKAERVFTHKLADSYLKDALFSKDPTFRREAKMRLENQIADYNKLMGAVDKE